MERQQGAKAQQAEPARGAHVAAAQTPSLEQTPEQKLIQLQQSLGNRAVGHLLGGRPPSERPSGHPTGGSGSDGAGDGPHTPPGRLRLAPPPAPFVQRKRGGEGKERVQLKSEDDASATETAGVSTQRPAAGLGAGRPLDAETRAFFEPRFGHDFAGVRIHDDTAAEASAHSTHALAYTFGHQIVFRSGQYSPTTDEGRCLLGHELAHVVQQSGGAGRVQGAGLDHDAYEAEADRAAEQALSGSRVSALSHVGALRVQKAPPKKSAPSTVEGTYSVSKDKASGKYHYTFNSNDIINSSDPWRLVVLTHIRNLFPGLSADAQEKILAKLWSGGFTGGKDIKEKAKTEKIITIGVVPELHKAIINSAKFVDPKAAPAAPVEAVHGLEDEGEGTGTGTGTGVGAGAGAGVSAQGSAPATPPATPSTTPASTTGQATPKPEPQEVETVKGQSAHIPANLKPEDKEKVLQVLKDILGEYDPTKEPEKRTPPDLYISRRSFELLLQIADHGLRDKIVETLRGKEGGGLKPPVPSLEEKLETIIEATELSKARKDFDLDEPDKSDEPPVQMRPVHGQIVNLSGYLVPGKKAQFTFNVEDDVDPFRVPHISIRWFAHDAGDRSKLVNKEVTNYIPVRAQSILDDRIFDFTIEKTGAYEIEALVYYNFFQPALFKTTVRVVTETALAKELNEEELKGFAQSGQSRPHLFDVGGLTGYQMGTVTRGQLDPKAVILSIEDRLKATENEEQLVKDLIATYEGQKTAESAQVVDWAKNYLKTLKESGGALKTAKKKGGVPLGVKGVFVSRTADVPSKSLNLLCYFLTTPGGYQLFLHDFTQLYEPEDYRFEANDKTVDKAEETAFINQAEAYPFGTLSVTFQSYDETTGKPSDRYVKFEKITDTVGKKVKAIFFSTVVDIAVNLAAAIMMVIPGLQPLGIAIAIVYNTSKTVAELEEAANKGTLTSGKLALGVTQIALNLIPLAGRGAKLITIAGKSFYAVEAISAAGNVLCVTAEGMSAVAKLRNGVIKELAEVEGQIRQIEKTNLADPALPDLKKKKEKLIQEGQDATLKVFTELIATQAMMMVGQHLIMGYMSRKFALGELKNQGVFKHEKDAKPRYDFKEGVIVGDEMKITPAELDKLQLRHGQNKALESAVPDPVERQKIIESLGDQPVEVRTGAAKTGVKQEGGKNVLEVADGAQPADILAEAPKAKDLPALPTEKKTEAADAGTKKKGEAEPAPEDAFKSPEKKEPPPAEKATTEPPPDSKKAEAEGEVALSLEEQAKAAYAAAKKKGYGAKKAKDKQLDEQGFIDEYKKGKRFDLEKSRWTVPEPGGVPKPPPEPFPVGTDTDMILKRLAGSESKSTFKKFYEMLTSKGVASDAEVRKVIDDVRKEYNLDTKAATVDDIRHAIKEKFRDKIVRQMFEASDGKKLDAKASHQKMRELTENLNSADKGPITEAWIKKTREAAGAKETAEQVVVKAEEHKRMKGDRRLDRIEGEEVNEIKSGESHLDAGEKAELDDHLALVGKEGATLDVRGKPQTVKKVKWTFTSPEGGRTNADFLEMQLKANDGFSVEVYNDAHESKVFTKADVSGANEGKLHEFVGKPKKKPPEAKPKAKPKTKPEGTPEKPPEK